MLRELPYPETVPCEQCAAEDAAAEAEHSGEKADIRSQRQALGALMQVGQVP